MLKFLLLPACEKSNKPVFKRKAGKRDSTAAAGGRGHRSRAERCDALEAHLTRDPPPDFAVTLRLR